MKDSVPGESEGIRHGDGVRSRALAHAIELKQRNVQTEEKLQGVFGYGSCSRVAPRTAIQSQRLPNLPEHQTLRKSIV